jgi:hypothetical protein
MSRQRSAHGNPTSLRNLPQFRDMTDEEFAEYLDRKNQGIKKSVDYEARIEGKLAQFAEDYDLDDLKANDRMTLRALAQAMLTLEDYELWAYDQRSSEQLSLDKMLAMEKLGSIQSNLRKDISNMQNDLMITRKVRKSDSENSVIDAIENLKMKAKEFYKERMYYVWCPNCKMLLATMWFHYPDNRNNKLSLKCERCNHVVTTTSIEIGNKRGVNIDEIPEYFK